MGYSYSMKGRLCCDSCGTDVAVRKVKCPFGHCPAIAACPDCRKKHGWGTRAKHIAAGCDVGAAKFAAWMDEKARRLEAGEYLRCSALGMGDDWVHVLFDNKIRHTIGYYMSHKAYDSIPLLTWASPADYRRVSGEAIHPAPDHFEHGKKLSPAIA